tara:strand:+ start:1480 stop:1827 length:348 start_codon:yes stop_codon:yes gene_type:complete
MQKYYYSIKVTRVVDGDTYDCMVDLGFNTWVTCRVRMYGINAPETRTRDLKEKEAGLKAKKWLIERVDKGEKVEMLSYGKGKYGRTLGELYIDGVNVNKEMVRKKLCKSYSGGKR